MVDYFQCREEAARIAQNTIEALYIDPSCPTAQAEYRHILEMELKSMITPPRNQPDYKAKYEALEKKYDEVVVKYSEVSGKYLDLAFKYNEIAEKILSIPVFKPTD